MPEKTPKWNTKSDTTLSLLQKFRHRCRNFGIDAEIPASRATSISASMPKFRHRCRNAVIDRWRHFGIDTEISAKNARANYELAIDNFYVSKKNMSLAKRIENKNQIKFSQGMVNSFELRQAQTQLYKTQNDYLNAIQDLISKKIELKTLLNIANN